MKGERFRGNINTREVHDLDQDVEQCHIEDVIRRRHERPFRSLDEAREVGFDPCGECIGASPERGGKET